MTDGPIIDAHTHLDCSSDDALAKAHEHFCEYMEQDGVVASLVMGKSVYHIDFFSEHNRLFELSQKDPRIFPIINFDAPHAGDEHFEATESWLAEGIAKAVKIYPGYDPFYPHEHPACLRLFAMAERLEKPVIIHCGDTVTPQGRLKYAKPLFLDDIAVGHPSLKIVMAHLGQPFFEEAQAVLFKNKHVVADGSGLFFSESPTFSRDAFISELISRFRMLFAYVDSADSVHFGGDFPFTNPSHHVRFWSLVTKELGFDDEEKHMLFYENARKIFDLPLPPHDR